MAANRLKRRAQLRAKALGESFQDARQHLRSTPPRTAVVPPPTRAQARLEGLLVVRGGLPFLHQVTLAGDHFPLDLEIARLFPARDRLEVWGRPADLEHLKVGLLPSCDLDVDGVVGVRVRKHSGDIEMYDVHGGSNSVVFAGYPTPMFAATHAKVCAAPGHCMLARRPEGLTMTEREYVAAVNRRLRLPWAELTMGENWVGSSLLRRLRLLTRLNTDSVRCTAQFDQVKVEVRLLGSTEADKQAALDALASRDLSPRWWRQWDQPGYGLQSGHLFEVEGTATTVLIRFWPRDRPRLADLLGTALEGGS